MTAKQGIPRVLHVHATLGARTPLSDRSAVIIEAYGSRLQHFGVSCDGQFDALTSAPHLTGIKPLREFPSLAGVPLPRRLNRIACAMVDYHLVLTYGRAALPAAMAHTVFKDRYGLPPLIHHEDGSDENARQRRGWRSRWSRRIALGRAAGLVVPTETMEAAALIDWQQPIGRVKVIPDGADLEVLSEGPNRHALGRLAKGPGEYWIGCRARFDGSEDIAALLRALKLADDAWHLVLLGHGPAKAAVEEAVSRLGLDRRVHFVVDTTRQETLAILCDVIAVAGGRDLLPLAVVDAMAAGKPVFGIDPGEVAVNLSPENAEYLTTGGSDKELGAALLRLTGDELVRQRIGAANRERAGRDRDRKAMIRAYRRLYDSALGREFPIDAIAG